MTMAFIKKLEMETSRGSRKTRERTTELCLFSLATKTTLSTDDDARLKEIIAKRGLTIHQIMGSTGNFKLVYDANSAVQALFFVHPCAGLTAMSSTNANKANDVNITAPTLTVEWYMKKYMRKPRNGNSTNRRDTSALNSTSFLMMMATDGRTPTYFYTYTG
jgi:hypothetical protein